MFNLLKRVEVGIKQFLYRSSKEASPCFVGNEQITAIDTSRLVGDGTELCIISHVEGFKRRCNGILTSHNARI